ncbi:uncharacterized protein METZ01_LOCUS251698, partial [marine metagenome]
MRVAKPGRAQARRELVVQVIAGMTTTIEMGASQCLLSKQNCFNNAININGPTVRLQYCLD